MTTSKTTLTADSRRSEVCTKIPATQLTDTSLMNSPDLKRFGALSKSDANKILDRVKEGRTTPLHLIDIALAATGDKDD